MGTRAQKTRTRPRHGYDARQFVNIPLDRLLLGPNIRRDTGELDTLIESIREIGILEPILVCATEDGQGVEVLCGQRRTRAAEAAGLETVPCIVRPRPTEVERIFLQLVENAERKDMSPVEQGDTFLALRANGYTNTQIRQSLGRSEGWLQARCMVAALPDFYRDMVHTGKMTLNFALDIPRALSRDPDFTRKLAAVAHLGEQRMRDYVQRRIEEGDTAARGPGRFPTPTMDQQFNCRLPYEVIQLAKREANRTGYVLAAWLETAIREHAAKAAA